MKAYFNSLIKINYKPRLHGRSRLQGKSRWLLLGLLASLSLMTLALTGCQSKDPVANNPGSTDVAGAETTLAVEQPSLKVYASIYPLYEFAKQIGQDLVTVEMIIPPGTDAHDFEPSAKLVGSIESADILVYNGLGLEHWMDSLISSIGEGVLTVNTSDGVETLSIEAALAHDHAHEGEATHEDGSMDPHIWLDPQRALIQAENVLKAFIEKDPTNQSTYQANFEVLKAKLEKLDQDFSDALKSTARTEIVVGHAAFGYLTDRYGLEQLAISGISPLEEPSAAQLGDMSQLVKEHGVTVIFYEVLASPKFSEVIAAETGTKTAVLNPLEGLTADQFEKGEDYFTLMYQNLDALLSALN